MDERTTYLMECYEGEDPKVLKEYCRRQRKPKKPKPVPLLKELPPDAARAMKKVMRVLNGEDSEQRRTVVQNLLQCQDPQTRLYLRLQILEDMTRGSPESREKARKLALEMAGIAFEISNCLPRQSLQMPIE